MNSRRPAENEDATCPPAERLTGWLNESQSLSPDEIDHVSECKVCAQLLDDLSDAPDLASVSAVTLKSAGYEHEPEFRALKERLPMLSGVGIQGHSSLETVTTERANHLPSGDSFQERQLSHLRQVTGQRYRLQRILGSGGSGTVVLAYDQVQACDVAIKFLSREGPQERQRFEREAKILGELDHPNIVRIFEFGTGDSPVTDPPTGAIPAPDSNDASTSSYLVMEYVSGGSGVELQKRLTSDFLSLARMLLDVANGLHCAHLRGLVHRDVKPSNLLLDVKNQAWKVADFGLAKFEASESTLLTESGDILGTPAFMSPEQVLVDEVSAEYDPLGPQPVSRSTDIYSLGATMYALLTGQPPLQGSTVAILRQIPEVDPVRPRVLNPRIPLTLETICLHAIEKSPADRYLSMQAFAEDLERFIAGQSIQARPPSPWVRFQRWSSKNRVLAYSLFAVALLLGTIAAGSILTANLLWQQQQRLIAERQQTLQQLCGKIAVATPAALPLAVKELASDPNELLPYLKAGWKNAETLRARLNLACALASLGAGHEDFLIEQTSAVITSPGQCLAICDALSVRPEESLALLRQKLREDVGTDPLSAEHRNKLAILALHLKDPSAFRVIADSDPDSRTELIHLLPSWHGELSELIENLKTTDDPRLASAICLGLGLVDRLTFSPQQLEELDRACLRLEREIPEPGVMSAAYWLKRQLGLETLSSKSNSEAAHVFWRSSENLAADATLGFRMLRIPAGSFTMGSGNPLVRYAGRKPHTVTLSKSFWLADREVSVGLFQAFMEDQSNGMGSEVESGWAPNRIASPTPAHPAQQLSWFQAIAFCNWLSEQHGFEAYYEETSPTQFTNDEGQTFSVDNWIGRPSATGYRLPTEAEFEYACRAGTQTLFSFGNEMRFFDDYVAWSNNTIIPAAPCGTLKPNPWGLFEMHGNVWEWCEDWYQDFDSSAAVRDPLCTVPNRQGRIYRGGGICTYTGYPDSSSRGGALPHNRFNNIGFRVARTAEGPRDGE